MASLGVQRDLWDLKRGEAVAYKALALHRYPLAPPLSVVPRKPTTGARAPPDFVATEPLISERKKGPNVQMENAVCLHWTRHRQFAAPQSTVLLVKAGLGYAVSLKSDLVG